ncbi:uncharacterized protein LOC134770266 [Penaeus indicus]|uniref:uncharacterized protein LOC134770266 n=1 Tax=Penaeus indicus TaxID=29960 RepID=UPI00300CDC8C
MDKKAGIPPLYIWHGELFVSKPRYAELRLIHLLLGHQNFAVQGIMKNWSKLTIGLFLAAFVLMAVLSSADASALPNNDCCPFFPRCCKPSIPELPDYCKVIYIDCSGAPHHECCRNWG